MKYAYTTQQQIRDAFWAENPALDFEARQRKTRSKTQNYQTTDCRMAFCDFVEYLRRDGLISPKLGQNTSL